MRPVRLHPENGPAIEGEPAPVSEEAPE
jgi:hypothetical protein